MHIPTVRQRDRDPDAVHLYLEESFSFRVATPEAAVALTPGQRALKPRPSPADHLVER